MSEPEQPFHPVVEIVRVAATTVEVVEIEMPVKGVREVSPGAAISLGYSTSLIGISQDGRTLYIGDRGEIPLSSLEMGVTYQMDYEAVYHRKDQPPEQFERTCG